MNILITGGASGLGEAITRKLALVPTFTIYFTYFSSKEKADLIESTFSNTKGIYCDFRNPEDTDKLLEIMPELNPDILINNAYTNTIKPQHFNKTDISTFTESFQNNLVPLIRITQKAITIFKKKKFGKIISILSSAIINKPPVGWSEYTAGKAYLASLCKSWATENIQYNISSNAVSPSFMLTHIHKDTDERIIENINETHPLKKILTIEEVAETVAFLTTCSQQINGSNIIINAGSDVI